MNNNNDLNNDNNMNVVDFNNYQTPNEINPNVNGYQTPNEINPNINGYQTPNEINPNINEYQTQTLDTNNDSSQSNNIFGVPTVNEEAHNINNEERIDINFTNNVDEEKPKYGYESNEKVNLDADENSSIKFIIFLAILMLAVIILLPYLSNLL
jgi:hypothetical protein